MMKFTLVFFEVHIDTLACLPWFWETDAITLVMILRPKNTFVQDSLSLPSHIYLYPIYLSTTSLGSQLKLLQDLFLPARPPLFFPSTLKKKFLVPSVVVLREQFERSYCYVFFSLKQNNHYWTLIWHAYEFQFNTLYFNASLYSG